MTGLTIERATSYFQLTVNSRGDNWTFFNKKSVKFAYYRSGWGPEFRVDQKEKQLKNNFIPSPKDRFLSVKVIIQETKSSEPTGS